MDDKERIAELEAQLAAKTKQAEESTAEFCSCCEENFVLRRACNDYAEELAARDARIAELEDSLGRIYRRYDMLCDGIPCCDRVLDKVRLCHLLDLLEPEQRVCPAAPREENKEERFADETYDPDYVAPPMPTKTIRMRLVPLQEEDDDALADTHNI